MFELGFNEDVTGALYIHHGYILGIPDNHSHLILLLRSRFNIPDLVLRSLVLSPSLLRIDFYPKFNHTLASTRTLMIEMPVLNRFESH